MGSEMCIRDSITPPYPDAPEKSHLMLANTLGGIASRTLTAPLERIKLELQRRASAATTSSAASSSHDAGRERVIDICRRVLRSEGVIGFFRGNALNCARVVPAAMIGGACYTFVGARLPDSVGNQRALRQAVAGGTAGAVATFLTFPMDTLRAPSLYRRRAASAAWRVKLLSVQAGEASSLA